jgi:hypothetical protein
MNNPMRTLEFESPADLRRIRLLQALAGASDMQTKLNYLRWYEDAARIETLSEKGTQML